MGKLPPFALFPASYIGGEIGGEVKPFLPLGRNAPEPWEGGVFANKYDCMSVLPLRTTLAPSSASHTGLVPERQRFSAGVDGVGTASEHTLLPLLVVNLRKIKTELEPGAFLHDPEAWHFCSKSIINVSLPFFAGQSCPRLR